MGVEIRRHAYIARSNPNLQCENLTILNTALAMLHCIPESVYDRIIGNCRE